MYICIYCHTVFFPRPVSSRLVSSRLVFLHFSIHPLRLKIGLEANPSVDGFRRRMIQSSINAIPRVSVSTGSNKTEREEKDLSRVSTDRPNFSDTPRPARFDRAPRTRSFAPYFNICSLVFFSPPSILSFYVFFVSTGRRSDREIRCTTTKSPVEERGSVNPIGRSRNCAWQLLSFVVSFDFFLSQTRSLFRNDEANG